MMRTTSRTHKVSVESTGSQIELGEVRWLLDQMKALPDSHLIHVASRPGDARESGLSRLSADIPESIPQSLLRPLTDSPQA